jgi:hypothetical protein
MKANETTFQHVIEGTKQYIVPLDTDREIRASFDRLEGATRAVVDPGVSF